MTMQSPARQRIRALVADIHSASARRARALKARAELRAPLDAAEAHARELEALSGQQRSALEDFVTRRVAGHEVAVPAIVSNPPLSDEARRHSQQELARLREALEPALRRLDAQAHDISLEILEAEKARQIAIARVVAEEASALKPDIQRLMVACRAQIARLIGARMAIAAKYDRSRPDLANESLEYLRIAQNEIPDPQKWDEWLWPNSVEVTSAQHEWQVLADRLAADPMAELGAGHATVEEQPTAPMTAAAE